MAITLSRRTLSCSLAATAAAAVLPAPNARAAICAHEQVRQAAARMSINELGYMSCRLWTECVAWSDYIAMRGFPPRPITAESSAQDMAQLRACAAEFEIFAAAFFARPSPTAYALERKRLLLGHALTREELIPGERISPRLAEWTRMTEQDARRFATLNTVSPAEPTA